MALLWSLLLFGIYSLLALDAGAGFLLIGPIIGFGAGALSIVGGFFGVKRAGLGATLVLIAGVVGLLGAAMPLLLLPPVSAPASEFLIAYLTTGWWALLMVPVGGVALLAARREAEPPSDAAPGP
jgi:hypothetical protein